MYHSQTSGIRQTSPRVGINVRTRFPCHGLITCYLDTCSHVGHQPVVRRALNLAVTPAAYGSSSKNRHPLQPAVKGLTVSYCISEEEKYPRTLFYWGRALYYTPSPKPLSLRVLSCLRPSCLCSSLHVRGHQFRDETLRGNTHGFWFRICRVGR